MHTRRRASRVLVGLLAGTLMAASLPGMAAAAEPPTLGGCILDGTVTPAVEREGQHVGSIGDGLWTGPDAGKTVQAVGGIGDPAVSVKGKTFLVVIAAC